MALRKPFVSEDWQRSSNIIFILTIPNVLAPSSWVLIWIVKRHWWWITAMCTCIHSRNARTTSCHTHWIWLRHPSNHPQNACGHEFKVQCVTINNPLMHEWNISELGPGRGTIVAKSSREWRICMLLEMNRWMSISPGSECQPLRDQDSNLLTLSDREDRLLINISFVCLQRIHIVGCIDWTILLTAEVSQRLEKFITAIMVHSDLKIEFCIEFNESNKISTYLAVVSIKVWTNSKILPLNFRWLIVEFITRDNLDSLFLLLMMK